MATIVTKNSSTASAVPTTSDLVQGELAVNVTDKRIFTENASTQIVELGTNPSTITTATATVTGTLTANGTFVSSNAVLTGGTINGVVIGGTSPLAITGTNITATTGFVGGLTGNVTGNVTGNLTGNVTGNLTGNVTGNVTASTGTTTLNNLVVNGTADFTATKLVNVSTPTAGTDAANKDYVDTSVAAVIDSAPAALDTLNELAAALGDDANFASTITASIATKLPLAGGTMTGAIAMGTSKITGLGDPTAAQDAATKNYVDTQDALKLSLTGGTMSGAIAMGTNKITGLGTPTDGTDATTKTYVDGILSSGEDAAAAASAAATSASEAAASASAASGSATDAANSATEASGYVAAAAAAGADAITKYDEFDDRYLGAKSSAPATDNDGDALITGALYFNTVSNTMFVYTGSSWAAAGSAVNGTAERQEYTATSGQTNFAATYDVGFVDVYLNGIKLIPTVDFTATDGATIVLGTGATTGDNVSIIAYGAFNVADVYTQAQSDARYTQQSNNLSDLDDAATARTNLGLGTIATAATSDYAATANNLSDLADSDAALTNLGLTATATELNYVDGVTSNIQTQIDNIDALPSQTGNDGLFLTTDGTDASWAAVEALPDQSGNAGSYLTTDGTDASWAALEVGTATMTASGSITAGDPVALNSDGTVSKIATTFNNLTAWPEGLAAEQTQVGNYPSTELGLDNWTAPIINSSGRYVVHCSQEKAGTNSSPYWYWQVVVRLYKLNEENKLELLDAAIMGSAFSGPTAYEAVGADISYDAKYVVAAGSSVDGTASNHFFSVFEIRNDRLLEIWDSTFGVTYQNGVPCFIGETYDFIIPMNGETRRWNFSDGWSTPVVISHSPYFDCAGDRENYNATRILGTNYIALAFRNRNNNNYPTLITFNGDNNTYGTQRVLDTSASGGGTNNIVMTRGDTGYVFYVAWPNDFNNAVIQQVVASGTSWITYYSAIDTGFANVQSDYTMQLAYHHKTQRVTLIVSTGQRTKTAVYYVNGVANLSLVTNTQVRKGFNWNTQYGKGGGIRCTGIEGTDVSVLSSTGMLRGAYCFNSLSLNATNVEKYIGIATETISSGNTGSIKLIGSTYTTSGLTAGTTYYVDSDGSLIEDPQLIARKQKIGRALSSTQLLLES